MFNTTYCLALRFSCSIRHRHLLFFFICYITKSRKNSLLLQFNNYTTYLEYSNCMQNIPFFAPRPIARKLFLTMVYAIWYAFLALPVVALPSLVQDSIGWQQSVKYSIDVALNDIDHELSGNITIEYTNHSPDQLSFIWLHLYPNAYSNDQTAFAEQQLENRSTRFYYAKTAERGYIDQLDFKTPDGMTLRLEYDPKNPDIAKLNLSRPLKSGETAIIASPFRVKIPNSFSRLGHVGQSYQITQWYPKPAVYDATGWHAMPYLDQGEFYGEYGSFDVRITLPDNYIVGATGDLQNTDEQERLLQLAEKTAQTNDFPPYTNEQDFPPSSASTKTLRYLQDRVHDFAWFADKRFHVLRDEVTLASGRKVAVWAMFTNQEADLWKRGAEYVGNAVLHYSRLVGEYPYNHATAVQSALSAGAGMEYPNITVIGQSGTALSLETVIVHEVGHNWFYGQLGSNEREHPWMDEGINSYYERRYIREHYPDTKLLGKMAKGKLARTFDLADYNSEYLNYLLYAYNARQNEDQAIEGHAAQYTPLNYGGIVYGKTAMAFRWLEASLGTTEFDRIMQQYYREYEFKHPQPADLRRILEANTPKNLEWFFDELLTTNAKTDYTINKVHRQHEKIGNTEYDQISLRQPLGSVRGSYSISAYKQDSIVKTIWYDGFNGKMDVLFPSGDYDSYQLDAAEMIPDLYRKNNNYHFKGLCKKSEPLRLQFLGSIENPNKRQVFWSPAIGYNVHNGAMLGLALYNGFLPPRKIEVALVPMYAFGSKSFAGMGRVAYYIYPKSIFSSLQTALGLQYFSSGTQNVYLPADSIGTPPTLVSSRPAYFSRLSVTETLTFKNKNPRSSVVKQLTARYVRIERSECDIRFINTGTEFCTEGFLGLIPKQEHLFELGFSLQDTRVINPYGMNIALRGGGDSFISATATANYRFSFRGKQQGFDTRLFAGYIHTDNNAYRLGTSDRSFYDVMLDDIYVGRYEDDGLWSRQVSVRNGGMKFARNVGLSDNLLLAANFKSSVVRKLPLRIYADIAMPIATDSNTFGSGEIWFDGGIAITPLPNVFEIYVPLVHTSNLNDIYRVNGTKWYEKITFMLRFDALNPLKMVRQISSFL